MAEGKSATEARDSAQRAASHLVEAAADYRQTGSWEGVARVIGDPKVKVEAAEEIPKSWRIVKPKAHTKLLDQLLGSRARMLIGGLFLLVYAFWIRNSIPEYDSSVSVLRTAALFLKQNPLTLHLTPVPAQLTDILCSPAAGLAGFLLLVSVLFRGMKMTFCLLPAIAVLGIAGLWLGRIRE